MLGTVALLFAGVMAAAKLHVTDTLEGLVFYIAFRWGVGVLLVCWLTADHIYSTVQQSLESGRLREWRVTTMTPGDIGEGLARGTSSLLMPTVIALGVVDAAVPVRLQPPPAEVWPGVLIAGALVAVHAMTTALAGRFFAHHALRFGGRPKAWATGMARLGLWLALYTVPTTLIGAMAALNHDSLRVIAVALAVAAAIASFIILPVLNERADLRLKALADKDMIG